jgi:hypothetical protein
MKNFAPLILNSNVPKKMVGNALSGGPIDTNPNDYIITYDGRYCYVWASDGHTYIGTGHTTTGGACSIHGVIYA